MSVKEMIDKTMTALETAKTRCEKFFDLVNSLSIRNKASFDVSVKHKKYSLPVWRYGVGYTKEIRVAPILLCFVAGILAVGTAIKIANHKDK